MILACFAIGFGAGLTPIGEPLSTITVVKLKGIPYQADFFFLFRHLGPFLIPAILFFALFAAILMPAKLLNAYAAQERKEEEIREIAMRAIKVYLFVMALVLLGRGFKPIVEGYIVRLSPQGLYWLNILSAVVDNATLAAAEIDPGMGLLQIKSALLGLLIAGGMLIPGNIPNILCAGKLKIKSSEWAKFAVPLGFIVMAVGFFLLRKA